MKYYFTFGSGQTHENCYVVIEEPSAEQARVKMFSRFDNKWAFCYESAEKAGVARFNLREIEI